MSVVIDYQLVGLGWSKCNIQINKNKCDITASYLSDALKSLVTSTLALLLEEEKTVRFSFDEEPGEYRWIITRDNLDINIRILSFEELWSDEPDSAGEVIFSASCTIKMFSEAVVEMLNNIIRIHGLDGYKKKWSEHAFPKEEYKLLCEIVGVSQRL